MTKRPEVSVPEDYLRNIEKKVEDLKTLIEISAVISSTLNLNDLITIVMEKGKKIMSAEACSILLYNRETNKLEFEVALCKEDSTSDLLKEKVSLDIGQGIAGWVAEHKKTLLIEDAKTDKRFFQEADKLTGFTTKSLIAAPLIGRSGLIGVAEIMNPTAKAHFSSYDAEIFQTLCNHVAVSIENAYFHKESIQREKLKQELEIAAAVQKSFLPESPVFQKGNISVSAVNISASKIGGDVYDFIETADGRIGALIGDVSGKGVSAALYMAKIICDFRYVARTADSPAVTFSRMNSLLSSSPRGMFLTAIYIMADVSSGDIHVSVAGHPPFLWIAGKEVKVVDLLSGPPLGIFEAEYPVTKITIKKGDSLVFLTDGVFDAKNKKGDRIGFNKIVEFVKGQKDKRNLIGKIIAHVENFSKGSDRADDLTLMQVAMLGGDSK